MDLPTYAMILSPEGCRIGPIHIRIMGAIETPKSDKDTGFLILKKKEVNLISWWHIYHYLKCTLQNNSSIGYDGKPKYNNPM